MSNFNRLMRSPEMRMVGLLTAVTIGGAACSGGGSDKAPRTPAQVSSSSAAAAAAKQKSQEAANAPLIEVTVDHFKHTREITVYPSATEQNQSVSVPTKIIQFCFNNYLYSVPEVGSYSNGIQSSETLPVLDPTECGDGMIDNDNNPEHNPSIEFKN